jgi:hypothetical protein
VRLYTWRRTGLADEVRSDAIPDAAGGEGGHGAARPDGVIHRYVNYRLDPADARSGVANHHYPVQHHGGDEGLGVEHLLRNGSMRDKIRL